MGVRRSGFHVLVDLMGQPIRAMSQGVVLQLDPTISRAPRRELRTVVQWSWNSLTFVKGINSGG
jgi:hypothetical protein